MLREVKNGGWQTTGIWFWRRHVFLAGRSARSAPVKPLVLADMELRQASEAVPILREGPRTYWWCLTRFYWDDDGLDAHDVFALVYDRQLRARRKIERAHATLATGRSGRPQRDPIPAEVRRTVWERDGGACRVCGSRFELQYDHVIPVALGGASTIENLQILCADCNRGKGAALA